MVFYSLYGPIQDLADSVNSCLFDPGIRKNSSPRPLNTFDAKNSESMGHEDLFDPVVRTQQLVIQDSKEVFAFYVTRFKDMQHSACKIMSKAFVKLVEPKKQTHYPYIRGDEAAPPWWPTRPGEEFYVRHREPDHLLKPERIQLLVHILRMIVQPHSKQHPSVQKAGLTVKKLEEATNEAMSNWFGDREHPENANKKPFLKEIFKVAKMEERWLNNEIEGTTNVPVMYGDRLNAEEWDDECEEDGFEAEMENEDASRNNSLPPNMLTPESIVSPSMSHRPQMMSQEVEHRMRPIPHRYSTHLQSQISHPWICSQCLKPISVSPSVSGLENCSCFETFSIELLEQALNIELKNSAKGLNNPSNAENTFTADSRQQNLEYDGSKYIKATETRPRLGKKEFDILEASFRKNPKPTTRKRRTFAEAMGVDLAQINNWFQNRRAKRKQEKKQEKYESRHAQDPQGSSEASLPAVSYTPPYADPSQSSMESLQRVLATVRGNNPLSPQLDICSKDYCKNGKLTSDETALSSAAALEKSSTRDSASVEDETDWDGVSSLGSDTEKISLQMDPVNRKGEQDSLLGQELTAAQLGLVHCLMEEFWVIFNDRWQSENKQQGSTHSGSPSGSSSSMLEAPSFAKSISSSSKRPRHSENEDSDSEKSRPSKRKGKESQGSDPFKVPLRFACPFRKHNSRKYCLQTWRTCALTPHTTVARVKAHLYAYHSIHQCQRCKDIFNSETDLDLHIEACEPCQTKTIEPVDGITNKIRAKLQSRKKAHPQQTEAERWKQIYEILFQPKADEIIPSPYFEPIRDGEEKADTSSHHRDFANYEAYLRRELPRTFNAILERAVTMETNLIGERLRGQLRDMIQEAQNQIFASWRALQMSESSIPMPQETRDPVYLSKHPSNSGSDIPSNSESSGGIAVGNYQDTLELEGQHAFSISDNAEPGPPTAVNDDSSFRRTDQEYLNDLNLIDNDWAINLNNFDIDFPQEISGD